MALDFAILGEDGAPQEQISIRSDEHHRLVELARSTESHLLPRAADFYEDSAFAAAEVPALLCEIDTLIGRAADDEGLLVFLHSLKRLASKAHAANVAIEVIAD